MASFCGVTLSRGTSLRHVEANAHEAIRPLGPPRTQRLRISRPSERRCKSKLLLVLLLLRLVVGLIRSRDGAHSSSAVRWPRADRPGRVRETSDPYRKAPWVARRRNRVIGGALVAAGLRTLAGCGCDHRDDWSPAIRGRPHQWLLHQRGVLRVPARTRLSLRGRCCLQPVPLRYYFTLLSPRYFLGLTLAGLSCCGIAPWGVGLLSAVAVARIGACRVFGTTRHGLMPPGPHNTVPRPYVFSLARMGEATPRRHGVRGRIL